MLSLVVLVKGAGWLLKSAEKIGLAAGLSSFVIGVVIVGLGTSLPEVISSIVATMQGVTEMVAANAIGSNIANILLVVGVSALIGRKLVVSKDLIDLDLPLLAATTVLFLGVAMDGQITRIESMLLMVAFFIYFIYSITYKDESTKKRARKKKAKRPKIVAADILFLILGLLGLIFGAKYLVDSVIELATIFDIGVGAISLAAVAVGTSLPELIVSVKAALAGKSDVALGNIFGSNVFNLLLVVGLPGLFTTIAIDHSTLTLGIPVLIVATLLFIIGGISKRMHSYEGAMYLVIYALFIGKLFNLM